MYLVVHHTFRISGIPTGKLGLAVGPLIVSILISRFGPQLQNDYLYTTMSANLMLREMNFPFLACVGLGAGKGFVEAVIL